MILQPRYYQLEAEAALYHYFDENIGNPLICMPTGTGKSLVIAMIIHNIMMAFPNTRIMMLTHVKKLIEQNAKTLQSIWPTAPLGIYSAGLNSRESIMPIVFGGVQSVVKNIGAFGWRDLIFIDEAHLCGDSEDASYNEIIKQLKMVNPAIKVVGLSATPFRNGMGMLTDGNLYDGIAYDITGFEAFNRLIAEGFISPLVGKPATVRFDLNGVGMHNGDFAQKALEKAIDKDDITYAAVREMVEFAHSRQHWMVFAAGVNHTEHVTAAINSFGIPATCVHSGLSIKENDKRLRAYEQGLFQAIVGANMLTTGYDFRPIDFIGDMQPTAAPGKHVQKGGRGTRPSPETGKVNCLYLDFGGNVARCGPINDPIKPRKPGDKAGGDSPVKLCDGCGAYNHASARICVNCGCEFAFATKLFKSAYAGEVLRSDASQVEYFDVKKVMYYRHEKRDKNTQELLSPPSIKVTYHCDRSIVTYSEWILFEGKGLPLHRAHEWWRARATSEPPATTYEALARLSQLREPRTIRVHVNKKPYPEILGYEF